jgi:adenine-specific DNA-methyltransferase
MTITEIRQLLESPYNQKDWKAFIQNQFTNNKLQIEHGTIELGDNPIAKHCLVLGNYEVDERTKIGIFEIQISDKVKITRNRVALRNILKQITAQVAGAMVVFVQGDKWRFSYISKRKVKNKETNQIEDKETAPKRFTYLFGKNEKAKTAADRFDKLIQKQKGNIFQYLTLNDFEEAFSVEKLSKEFFDQYKNTYEDFVQFITGKRYGKKGNKYVEQIIHEPNWQLTAIFGKDEKQARDFCKRIMGRIVFLYFIQKKGWLAVAQGKKWGEGNPDYLFDLFKKSKHKDDFYHQELVPLFFRTLNNPDSENESNVLRFPYLNGGLFDDSHDRKYSKLHLPEEIFKTLFDTFNNFNFTIYEDAPDEHTVAVDPEMLGHIFENLLEDNKDKGAFYTPKEIVHYMCKESLKAYLFANDELHLTNNDLAKITIAKIIQQQELNIDEKHYAEKNAYKIIDALEQVKICDPAIGSGAFPMGLLQEIFNAQIYLQELKGFKKGVSDADIKKHIIEESIYGVDIDAGAVDISRLRFWLSLVVDEQVPQPLPNLNFKIVCANTLIPLGNIADLDFSEKAGKAVKELENLRHDFFSVSSDNKLKLERQFKKIQTDLLSLRELATKTNYEVYTKLYEFNPFEDTPCSWFDAWWMFGVKDGFDIVIGNPPYVGISKLKDKKILEKHGYKTFENTGDIYSLFYEVGNKLLKNGGCLNFITSRQWINAGYGKSTRKYFAEETNPIQLIDFGKSKIFESATVFVNILIFQKGKNLNQLKACLCPEDFKISEIDLESYFNNNSVLLNNVSETVWKIGEDANEAINQEIEQKGVRLKDWKNIEFYAGIKTAYNPAFHIDEAVKNELISKDKKNAEIIKPLLRGKDIKRYGYTFEGMYLINTHNGVREIGLEPIKASKDYPTIFEHLLQYETELRKRDDQGVHWSNLRNCAFLNEFEKEKIVWIEISDRANFTYDTNGMYLTNSAYFMSGKNLKYILTILNSKVSDFYFSQITAKIAGGRMRYTKQYVEQIPIPQIKSEAQIPFEILADYLLYLNDKSKTQLFTHTDNTRIASHIEEVLNMMVNELYFKEHMKEAGIDVLQFINPESISNLKTDTEKEKVIKDFYLWLQTPNNLVRQRINIVDIKSPKILSKINLATQ